MFNRPLGDGGIGRAGGAGGRNRPLTRFPTPGIADAMLGMRDSSGPKPKPPPKPPEYPEYPEYPGYPG